MSKICPLFFTSTADLEEFECRPDRCAWAYENRCAVTALARFLDKLSQEKEEYDNG